MTPRDVEPRRRALHEARRAAIGAVAASCFLASLWAAWAVDGPDLVRLAIVWLGVVALFGIAAGRD
jgi:hypothetical protein